jgi:D-glucosaminate-6-phosphate ammonia-lyase
MSDSQPNWNFHDANGLSRVINVNGTMTGLGASRAVPAAIEATAEIMPHFVKIHELQSKASCVIQNLTGAEAGFISASAAAGLSMSIAGAMTGLNPAHAEQLPRTLGSRNKVPVQMGHLCHYGAAIEQAISLTGATCIAVGQSTQVLDHQLEATLDDTTAAAVYVVSHHVVEYGQIPLGRFCEICHASNVPVIVDAASEYDLRSFLKTGADLVIYSGHKFLGGPTSGIVAGRKELVKSAYIQNLGIGRGMKVGKESIFGVMAALAAWQDRDHEGIRAQENAAIELWQASAAGFNGVEAVVNPDVTGNPLDRLKLVVDPARAGASAAAIGQALSLHNPPIIVRDHEVELGYIQLDPCNLAPGQSQIVAQALAQTLLSAKAGGLSEPDLNVVRNAGIKSYLEWS